MAESESRATRRTNTFERVSDAVVGLNTDFEYTFLNSQAEELLDATEETLFGTTIWDAFPEAIDSVAEDTIRKAVETGDKQTYERYNETVDRWFAVRIFPDEHGLSIFFTDISERKERTAELNRYKQLVESLPVAAGMNTPGKEGTAEFVNQAAVGLFDAPSKAEVKAYAPGGAFANEADRKQFSERLREAGSITQQEVKLTTLDGEAFWAVVTAELTEINGEEYSVWTITDTAERKPNQQELRYKTRAIEEAPIGVSLSSYEQAGNPIVYVNERFEEITGYTATEAKGRHCRFLQGEATTDESAARLGDAIENGEAATVELRSYRKDGELFWNRVSIAPVTTDAGLSHFVGFHQDITPTKQRSQELAQRNEQITAQNQALGSFADIASDPDQPVAQQITSLLELGTEYLDLDVGIVSDVEDTTYRVRNCVSPDDAITAGDVFDLSETFCSLVYEANEPVSFHTPADGGVKKHPAYRKQGAESYIGVPIYVAGERYGTLNFSDPSARTEPITEGEESFVRILAQWIGGTIQRQQYQRELERTSEFLRETQNVANVGGWELDLRSETLRWSDELYRIHELPLDADPTPEDAIEFYHPDDRETISDAFDRLTTEGEPYNLELRIVTADDNVRWVRTHGKPRYENNEIVAAHGTFQDITERKEREQKLQALTERVELAVNGANIGIWDWDMATDTVTYNEQWAEMLECSLEEVEPHVDEWEHRVHPADRADVEAALDDHIVGKTDLYEAEHRMRTGGGDWKWIRAIGRVVEHDDDGRPARAVGINLDIDDQKTYERTLEEQRNNLKVLNQMVRHDIRNNLHIVVSYAKMLTDDVENGGEEYLRKVIDAGSEAIDITQTAGDVTKAMLRSEADLTSRNLRSVLEAQISQVRENHDQAIISTAETLPDVDVIADEMLESVFRNLLTNAITHNDKELPAVTVSTQVDTEVVRVRIADNGPGIPAAQKEQIFCEGEKGLDSDGTGIGLYLVETLVDRYDGAVWVEDNDPNGSVFTVEMRREKTTST